jgi:hypothetical protein
MRKLALITALAASLATAAVALAAPERDLQFRRLGGSTVSGEGTIKSVGAETGLTVVLRGLTPGKKFRMLLSAGTCARRKAPFTGLGEGKARHDGTSYTSSLVRRAGAPIAFKSLADGKHVIVVHVGTRTVACAVIPA